MSLDSGSATAPSRPASTSLLAKKKRIRGGYKAHCTKLITEAKHVFESDEVNLFKLEHLSVSLKDKLTVLRSIDDEIFNLIDDDDVEAAVLESEELRSEIQGFIIRIDAKRDELKLGVTKNVSSTETSLPSRQISVPENAAKLPKLQLPKFQGDPRKWPEWWDAFDVIHNSTSLTPTNKFRHLKSLLEGPAETAISGIQITGANYNEAIDILRQRFAQKQVIINAHMETLLNLQKVSSDRDLKAFRKLFDTIEVNVRSLKSLGIDFEQYGALLVPVLMSKIPDEIRLEITKGAKGENWKLDYIMTILKAELEAREQCSLLKQSSSSTSKINAASAPYTTSAFFSSDGKITCSFCKGTHQSAKCHIVSNPQARKEILRKQGRCYVCLKKGHLSRACSSNIRCYSCKLRHHVSICESRGQAPHAELANPLQLHQSSVHQGVNPRAPGVNFVQLGKWRDGNSIMKTDEKRLVLCRT
eukprot:gene14292-5330_t